MAGPQRGKKVKFIETDSMFVTKIDYLSNNVLMSGVLTEF